MNPDVHDQVMRKATGLIAVLVVVLATHVATTGLVRAMHAGDHNPPYEFPDYQQKYAEHGHEFPPDQYATAEEYRAGAQYRVGGGPASPGPGVEVCRDSTQWEHYGFWYELTGELVILHDGVITNYYHVTRFYWETNFCR